MKRYALISLLLLCLPVGLLAQTTVVKQSTPEPLYLTMQSTTTGADTAGLTLTAHYIVGTGATETLGTGTFVDAGNGSYSYLPSSAELATVGKLLYRFSAAGAYDYKRELRVVTVQEADVYARLGAPAGASLSADIAANATALTNNGTAIAALPSATTNAAAVWAATTRSLTDKTGFSLTQSFPANFALLGINGTGQFTAPTLALAPVSALTGIYYAPILDSGATSSTSLVVTVTNPTSSATSRLVSWTADSAATSYKIMRSVDGVNYTKIATVSAGTLSYTDAARPTGNVYYSVLSVH